MYYLILNTMAFYVKKKCNRRSQKNLKNILKNINEFLQILQICIQYISN